MNKWLKGLKYRWLLFKLELATLWEGLKIIFSLDVEMATQSGEARLYRLLEEFFHKAMLRYFGPKRALRLVFEDFSEETQKSEFELAYEAKRRFSWLGLEAEVEELLPLIDKAHPKWTRVRLVRWGKKRLSS